MLALTDIKATITANARSQEICDSLHDALIATTEDELIDAGIPVIVYAYQSAIVDDALLSNFTEGNLNIKGIYTTGAFSLTNPDVIFILKDAVMSITVDGNSKSKITCMGACNVTITSSDNAYVELRSYDDSVVNITANVNSLIDVQSKENASVTITQNDATVSQINSLGNSVINHTGNQTSFSNSKAFGHSVFTYALFDTATMLITGFNSATINAPLPV
jgi:hypothetical protein